MADIPASWQPRLAAKARLRWDNVEKRHMLVFPEAALLLNETALIANEVAELLTRLQTRGLLETERQ
jgi:hypothetical protein